MGSGKGRCMRACTPGGLNGTCEGVAPHMSSIVEDPELSLFCFAAYTENTGNSKPNLELQLLQEQHQRMASIFSCAEWAVYADVVVPLGGGDMTIQVDDVRGDFHILKRKETNTWVNSGMFVQIWTKVRDAGHYKNHNWVIKADADAVFFPYKLINVLRDISVPQQGVYLENCKCMDMLGVGRQENFALTTDGACEADRPVGQEKNKKYVPECAGVSTPSIHPLKEPTAWVKCWEEAKDVSNA